MLLAKFRVLPGLTLLDDGISGRENRLPEHHKASKKTIATKAMKSTFWSQALKPITARARGWRRHDFGLGSRNGF